MTTDLSQWKYVPGELNPADLATRGTSPTEMNESKFWKEGPTLIKSKESIYLARKAAKQQFQVTLRSAAIFRITQTSHTPCERSLYDKTRN